MVGGLAETSYARLPFRRETRPISVRQAGGQGTSGNYSITREQFIFTCAWSISGNIIAENLYNLSSITGLNSDIK
jgi:hypothetical protein